MGGWVRHPADKRGKVGKSKFKSFVTSLERADKKTGWVSKKLIIHFPITVTKWVWMASLIKSLYFMIELGSRLSHMLLRPQNAV